MARYRLRMNRNDIPKHLRHLSDEKLKALFYLFRART
jgi:hypothetical protein